MTNSDVRLGTTRRPNQKRRSLRSVFCFFRKQT